MFHVVHSLGPSSRFQRGDESVSDPRPVLQPPEKSGDSDGSLATGRNKEILRLDIPLSDSGSAGLGVSVKGKTMTTDRGTKDLGIFVKSVIHGGAASKVGWEEMISLWQAGNYQDNWIYYLFHFDPKISMLKQA